MFKLNKNKIGFTQHHFSGNKLIKTFAHTTHKSGAGFTLIELLVVIAIIGTLSAIGVISLSGSTNKAKVATTEKTLSAMIPAAILCQDNGNQIYGWAASALPQTSKPCTGSTIKIIAGKTMCVDPEFFWPSLPNGVIAGECLSNQSSGTFSFSAAINGTTITCSNDGCSTSN